MQFKKIILISLLGFFLIFRAEAQIGKIIKNKDPKDLINKDPKDIAKDLKNDAVDAGKAKVRAEIDELRNDYDTTMFSYVVSLSDNAGLFEDKEKGDKLKKLLALGIDRSDVSSNLESDPMRDAQDLTSAGQMGFQRNMFRFSDRMYGKSQSIYEKNSLTSNLLYPQVLASRGALFHTTGRYSESEALTLQALELRKSIVGTKHSAYASSVNNLAMLYKDLGRYTEAEKLISEAVGIVAEVEGKQSDAYAIVLNNKAMLFQVMGRYPEAEKLMQESLSSGSTNMREKSSNYQRLQVNLALLYQEMGKYEEAEKIYLEAIRIKESRLGKSHPDYAHMLNNLSALYMLMGKYDEVEKQLLQAKSIYEKQFGKQHPAYASTISNLGNLYRIKDRNSESESLLREALEIRKVVLGENHPKFVQSQEELALIYWQMGKNKEAEVLFLEVLRKSDQFIKDYFPAMSESEKDKYWNRLRPTFLRFYTFATQYPDAALLEEMYNSHLITKAILLSATNKIKKQINSTGDRQLIKDYNSWTDLKEELAKLYSYSKAELLEQQVNLDSLEQASNSLEKKISERSSYFSQGKDKVITFNDLQSSLLPDEAIVDIIQFKKFDKVFTDSTYYAVFVITKDKTEPELVVLKNGNDLDSKYFKVYKNSIKQKLEDKISYKQFFAPVDEKLSGKSKLYTSLDGVYNNINISTLLKPDGKYLVDDKSIIVLSNAKDLIALKNAKANTGVKNAILVGFPNYGSAGTISPLPGTKIEVEGINSILMAAGFKTNLYLANEAKESNVQNSNNPTVLHIATHGFFINDVADNSDNAVFGIESSKAKANPLLRSGLMLKDAENTISGTQTNEMSNEDNGVLTAFEVMSMDLDNTELVVMSACETGLGDVKAGEGVYGLQRAFQVAGSKAVMMSLWKVSDEATKDLMTLFYQNWTKSGDKITAFKQAQTQLKQKYPSPYYWGAFMLIGR